MASGRLLEQYRGLFAKADRELQRWSNLQDEALSLFGTAKNIISRLPVLQDGRSYGPLRPLPGLQQALLGKQLLALEGVLADLQAALAGLDTAVAALGKLSRSALALASADKRLTPMARAARAGPVPSTDDCLGWLQRIWDTHSQELRLKQALVSELRPDLDEPQLSELLAAFAAQPNIDSGWTRDRLHLVAATEERATHGR